MSRVEEYLSPEVAVMALIESMDPTEPHVGVIFNTIPRGDRRKIRKLCCASFPARTHRQVKTVSFEKLIFSRGRGGARWGVSVRFMPDA